jgi:dipeptidyl aminopeptidase/acylaminoacyl peptidase
VRSFRGAWLAAIIAIGCATAISLAPARAADVDSSTMSAEEIKALEQRLTDAGCYKGAIDGQTSGALDGAIKACPDQRPVLRIETGMHTAMIRRVGVDAACSLLATASDDKTVRLWSLPDGKLKRIIRLPIGEGNGGKVWATDLSPDGRLLAAGGWDATWDKTNAMSLTLVDLSSGAIRRFGAFEGVINHVAFSGDGRRIAVGLGGKNGVRVLDIATGAELLADHDYDDSVYGLAFAPDGGLITSSDDGQLRSYGPDLKLAAKLAAPDGKDPYGVAIDPSGSRVAVGYYDEPLVSILDAKALAPLVMAQTSDVANGNLSSVAWSRDGATLVAGGRAQAKFQGEWRNFLRRFDPAGPRKGEDIPASDRTIFDIKPCGDGFAFATADPAFGLTLGTRRRHNPSGLARGRHARQARLGLRARARRLLRQVWTGRSRAEARPLRSRRGVADRVADPSPEIPHGENRRPPYNGLGGRYRAEVQGSEDRARGLRALPRPCVPPRRLWLRARNRLVRARLRRKRRGALEAARPGRGLGRRFFRRRRHPRRRLC